MSEKRAALTPKSWQTFLDTNPGRGPRRLIVPVGGGEEEPRFTRQGSWWAMDPPITQEWCHSVAATLLFGQPFGFTWDMVDRLRAVIDREEEAAGYMGSSHKSDLRPLADLLESLLPPRGP